MARTYAEIKTRIWADEDFRALPRLAQHLYFTLVSHPGLTYAGVVDWRPRKIAALCGGTEDEIIEDARVLGAAGFVVIDEAAEELLVRSYIRNDGIMHKARLPISMAKAYAMIVSTQIRHTIVHELLRIHSEAPNLPAWTHDLIAPILRQNSTDPASFRATGGEVQDHSGEPVAPSSTASGSPRPTASASPSATAKPSPSDTASGSPSTSTITITSTTSPAPTERSATSSRLPLKAITEDWAPSSDSLAWAHSQGYSREFILRGTEMLKNHFLGNGKRMKDWDRTWRNWLMRDEANPKTQSAGTKPSTSDSRVHQAEAAKANLVARGYTTGGQLALGPSR